MKESNYIRKSSSVKKIPYAELYQIASQYARIQDEAEDMVQDVLLVAYREKRDFLKADFMPWARGCLRNHASFLARSAVRRKRRETAFIEENQTSETENILLPQVFTNNLSTSLRSLALLINCGLNKKEIIYLLDIKDITFRQRLASLRKSWKKYMESGGSGPLFSPHNDISENNGLIRDSLRKAFDQTARRKIGSHDPDGHLFIISSEETHKSRVNGNNIV